MDVRDKAHEFTRQDLGCFVFFALFCRARASPAAAVWSRALFPEGCACASKTMKQTS